MKNLKTAPQILEHYYPAITDTLEWEWVLKAMRHYARLKREQDINVCLEDIKAQVREEVKDEMYEEARRNVLEQYWVFET